MKIKIILPISILLIVLLVVGLVITRSQDSTTDIPEVTEEQKLATQLSVACEVFSEENAKTLFGPEVEKTSDENLSASSQDVAVSQCIYVQKIGENDNSELQQQAKLVARVPRTDAGNAANSGVFDKDSRPKNTVDVPNYGQSAFWNEEFGQLNVLVDGTWYVLEFGSKIPSSRTLGDTEKFAEILQANL